MSRHGSHWITGGVHGFIGCKLSVALQRQGAPIRALRRRGGFAGFDLSNRDAVMNSMKDNMPYCIYHLAGNPIVRAETPEAQQKHIDSNYLSTFNLLSCLDQMKLYYEKPPVFVLASSSTVYGDMSPSDELCATTPTSLYAATKVGAEALVQAYTSLGTIRGSIARICATIGPSASHGLIPDVIKKLEGPDEYLELFGDSPGSRKPFLHIDDCVRGFMFMNDLWSIYDAHDTQAVVCNIAPKDNLSVLEVAEIAMQVLGRKKEIKWLGHAANWKGDNPHVLLDSTYITKSLEFEFIYTSSEHAVRQVVTDILNNKVEKLMDTM